jgi:uncharacterized protein
MKILVQRIVQFGLLLCLIQSVRAALTWGLWIWLHPSGSKPAGSAADIAAFLITGLLCLLVFPPGSVRIGLDWQNVSQGEKAIYNLLVVVLILGICGTYLMENELLMENIKVGLVIPIFEELIFRGWGWQRIESALTGKRAKMTTWLITSALFALWHIGYIDAFYLKVLPTNPGASLGDFLLWKVIFTFFFGLAVGFLRWRTGRVYGSMILHGFLNLLGR